MIVANQGKIWWLGITSSNSVTDDSTNLVKPLTQMSKPPECAATFFKTWKSTLVDHLGI